MTRRQLRENVFKMLFRVEFHNVEDMPEQMNMFEEVEECSEKDKEYISNKFHNIVEMIDEIDAAINAGNQPDKSWSEVANAKAALEAAVAALAKNDGPVVEEDADYTAVNSAKEKAAGVDRSRYTDESLKALDDAVAAVVEGLKKSEQSSSN